MLEPTYVLGFLGAAITVATVLVVGTFAAAGLIFSGRRRGTKASATRRPAAGPAARAGHRHGHAA
ncbi:hypothetical protein [Nocardioides sp.]|uniref:hypothetical protein n=1 Tax=Nocardioides sp. TaxID=35761 RepID=UPI002615F9E6|nr:hypothetical protein [Nocardioides sp.]MDI6912143.1 hypothetical protein [Nocardioides sp.]